MVTSPVEPFALEKPYLWVYWENKTGITTPPYITLCHQSIKKHCSNTFNVQILDERSILTFLPELQVGWENLSKLLVAQKVDFYRVLLLQKYGGLYLDSDILVLQDLKQIVDKLVDYDYVGFGCTGTVCSYGYGRPSNWAMASRQNGRLITQVANNLKQKLGEIDKKWEYHDLGKLVIWEELGKLIENGYKYYQYSNDYDGTRDIGGRWVTNDRLFSPTPIKYRYPEQLLFVVLYNSEMGDLRILTEDELLNRDTNMAAFFKKALF